MTRRGELAIVAVLIGVCAFAVIFVFSMLSRPGGSFDLKEASKEKSAPAKPKQRRKPPTRRAAPPPAAPKTKTKPAPPPAEAKKETATKPDAPQAYAELVLELLEEDDEDKIIHVTVRDVLGEPVRRALVTFREGRSLLYRARTDDAGYASYLPPDGTTTLRVDALREGFAPASARAAAPGAEVDLTLHMRPSVEGVVKAPSRGHGIVRLLTRHGRLQQKVGNDGRFLFEDLDEGPVTVQAEVDPYGAASRDLFLHEGMRERVLLRVRGTGRVAVQGRVSNWPGKGTMRINGVEVPVSGTGEFKFDKAVKGLNDVFIDAPKRAFYRDRFSVSGNRTARQSFSIANGAPLVGVVRHPRTKARLPNVEILVGVDFADERNREVPFFPIAKVPVVRTDHRGEFRVERPSGIEGDTCLDPALTYLLAARHPGLALYVGEVVTSVRAHRVTLPESPYVWGRVRALGGAPKNVVVRARRVAEEQTDLRFNVREWSSGRSGLDSDDFYGLSGLFAGTYVMRLDAPGFGSLETVLDLRGAGRRRLDLRILRRGNAADAALLRRLPPVAYEPGDEDAPVGTTALHVDARRGADKEPFPGVRVVFVEGEEQFAPPMDFEKLELELRGLPAARYRATLSHPTLKDPLVRESVVLRPGAAAKIEFK